MFRFDFRFGFRRKLRIDDGRGHDYFCDEWKVSKNKSIEVQISKWNTRTYTIFGINSRLSFKEDHAGFKFELELFDRSLIFNFYDHRHWNYEKDTWET